MLDNPNKQAFAEFLAIPRALRGMTQKEFAKKVKVSEQTLVAWKKDDKLLMEVRSTIRKNMMAKTSNVYHALYEGACDGKPALVKLYLEVIEGFDRSSKDESCTPLNIQLVNYHDLLCSDTSVTKK